MYYLVGLVIAAFLGLIPANIAKNKGYSFGTWWVYGWLLFIVAIIHVQFIPDKNELTTAKNYNKEENKQVAQMSSYSPADELLKYKELFDKGVLTEEEFASKKDQILNSVPLTHL